MTHDVSDRQRKHRKSKSSLSKEVRGASRGVIPHRAIYAGTKPEPKHLRKTREQDGCRVRKPPCDTKTNVNSLGTDNEATSCDKQITYSVPHRKWPKRDRLPNPGR